LVKKMSTRKFTVMRNFVTKEVLAVTPDKLLIIMPITYIIFLLLTGRKNMDINTLQVIGEGRLSIVYKLDGMKMLKVFRYPNVGEWEYKQSLAAWQAGASRQKPHELVQIDGKDAIIYDYLEGQVLLDVMRAHMVNAVDFICRMADCHAVLMKGTCTTLNRLKDSLGHAISRAPHLEEAQRALLLKGLEGMPDGDHVLHGDLHPMNIIINDGKLDAIDWMTATRGDPAADICRSWFMIRHSVQREDRNLADKIGRLSVSILAGNAYLNRVLKSSGAKKSAVKRWLPFVAAGRLCEERPATEVLFIQKLVKDWCGKQTVK
jgi:hypothetical protein